MKDFMGQISKNNDYKPSFGKAKPIKIDLDKVDDVVSTNINQVDISNKPTRDRNIAIEIEKEAEIILLENDRLREIITKLEAEKNKNLEAIEKLEKKVNKQLKTISDGNISPLFIDLSKNAKRMLEGIEHESEERGKWARINRNDLINRYGVHNSFFAQSKEELIANNLIEYKMDFYDHSKRKSSFYRLL